MGRSSTAGHLSYIQEIVGSSPTAPTTSRRCMQVDMELVKLKARAADEGHLILATWGTKTELENFFLTGYDPCRSKPESIIDSSNPSVPIICQPGGEL